MPTRNGSIKLFRLFGIDVYIHWAWFLAFFYLVSRPREYSSYGWNALEVVALFVIVLTHEFGHQLACRQTGGKTNDIVLWPLGGVAYVSPPQRPGAQLWSIAAGPLVNVILVPLLSVLVSLSNHLDWPDSSPDAYQLVHNIWLINIVLLVFNLLPIYPLDGGQILRSLLWFLFGRANSLLIASVIGLIGAVGLIGLAIWQQSIWLGLITVFVVTNCWSGLKQAQALSRVAKMPRREGFACPSCKSAPPLGELWRCSKCGEKFDTFLTQGACPHCPAHGNVTQCIDCGVASPISEWALPPKP
ncbi:MAG TPA: M50 family metallopeptidase [Verrucomicrobiae bacterium]|jgi:Zn-dependent protease